MSAIFCFKYKVKSDGHFIGSFKSRDFEEYTVAMKGSPEYSSDYGYNYTQNTLTIEWEMQSNKFIKVLIVSEQNRNILRNKAMFIDNSVRATIPYNYDDRISGDVLVVIDIAPCSCIREKPVAKPGDETATKEGPIVEKKLEKLSTDIKNFLKTGELSDVVLTDGSKEIRAHKFILCSRSSVFAKMFQHPTKENQENRITIKDISHEVQKELLDFMYSGTIVIKDSIMARDLYVAADKYDVKDLRDICATILKSVNVNSVLDTLLFADLYRDKMLKKAALDFISNNYSQMKATANWSSFMKEHLSLAVEVLSLVIDNRL